MNSYLKAAFCCISVLLVAMGCRTGSNGQKGPEPESSKLSGAVTFNSDSAYSYVAAQVAMGPRVPGSEANARCADYISRELTRHGARNISIQQGTVKAYNGDILPVRNIMGSFAPEAQNRILLVAHFDTRPWADSDPTEENRIKPVPGANDGGSGVGVLLEIARQLGGKELPVGVDMLFVDAEDYGQSSGFSMHDEAWCLGTQYWVDHMPYAKDSLPDFAILLDMVGGMGAKFHREYFSNHYAPQVVDHVWSVASKSGYGDRFVNVDGGAVIDDHVFLNKAGIPAIDIIESKNDQTKTFPSTWHTVSDDMAHIDSSTLKAAGQTVLNVIFHCRPSGASN